MSFVAFALNKAGNPVCFAARLPQLRCFDICDLWDVRPARGFFKEEKSAFGIVVAASFVSRYPKHSHIELFTA